MVRKLTKTAVGVGLAGAVTLGAIFGYNHPETISSAKVLQSPGNYNRGINDLVTFRRADEALSRLESALADGVLDEKEMGYGFGSSATLMQRNNGVLNSWKKLEVIYPDQTRVLAGAINDMDSYAGHLVDLSEKAEGSIKNQQSNLSSILKEIEPLIEMSNDPGLSPENSQRFKDAADLAADKYGGTGNLTPHIDVRSPLGSEINKTAVGYRGFIDSLKSDGYEEMVAHQIARDSSDGPLEAAVGGALVTTVLYLWGVAGFFVGANKLKKSLSKRAGRANAP